MNNKLVRKALLVGLSSVLAVSSVSTAVAVEPGEVRRVDENLMVYRKVQGISGNLSSVGSDTLNNLMTLWAESFNRFYPNVKVQIEGKGSSTAPPALIEGTAQLGPMSRPMKATEIDKFEAKFGYKPTPIRTAVDALAVFVHKDNPIKGLTMEQVDAIFSKTRRLGGKNDVATWGDLGLTGEFANKPISIYGRNSASGTYGFFKKHALGKGDFKDSVKEQPGSASVVQSVSVDRFAIGYSGIGYKTAGVKAVSLQGKNKKGFVEANATNSFSGSYPLARFLYVYVNKKPNKPMTPLMGEFIKLIASKTGQEIVIKDGYFPINAKIASEEISKLN